MKGGFVIMEGFVKIELNQEPSAILECGGGKSLCNETK